MAAEKNRERVQVDIADIIDQIDNYPEAAGVDPIMWAELSYPQKLRYLLKSKLSDAQKNLDAIDDE